MMYIRKVRLDDPGTDSSHITEVQYSFSTTGPLRLPVSREQVVHNIDAGYAYRTHHDQSGKQAEVVARSGPDGTRFITTVADGVETNNLLSLPRF